ncbi:MAG: hydrogenase nickel incorporation protein HypB [Polyangiaceae bacterium]|nr:hydrogenase nickel incorporation protein HypB [Polyangiaceae bacterium]
MCDTCGCGDHDLVPIEIHQSLLAQNDRIAGHNREHFTEHGVLALNIMGSPGSGKTALLEATARSPLGGRRILAVSGDLATDHDAQRLSAAGIESRAITTGTACHLDAKLVHEALHQMEWWRADLLFIENVGNLVCPAIYDLGQAANVVVLSVTEGEDKPLKYPVMFRKADLVVVSKIDLLPHLPHVSCSRLHDALARTMPAPRVLEVSAVTGQGIEEWIAWLEAARARLSAPSRAGHHQPHSHGRE